MTAPEAWARFRRWPWWAQALLWLLFSTAPALLWAMSRPAGRRRSPAALAAWIAILWFAAALSALTR